MNSIFIKKIVSALLLCFFAVCVRGQNVIQQAYISGSVASGPATAWSEFDHTFVWTTTEGATLVVTKTDATGYPLWSKEYLSDSLFGESNLQIDGNGTIYVCGYTDAAAGAGVNYFILCIDAWSVTQWSKQYETASQTEFTRPDLHILPNGDLWLTEGVNSHIGIIKTDASGNLISSHMYRGDLAQEWFEPGFNSEICSDGNMLVVGSTGPMHLTIIKTDNVGQMLWYRRYRKPASGNFPYDICELTDGSFLIAGQESQLPYLARVDSSGAFMWFKRMTFGAGWQGGFLDIEAMNSSVFLAAGHIGSHPILVEYDINGNIQQIERIYSPGDYMYGLDVCLSSTDSIAWPVVYNGGLSPATFIMFMDTLATGTCIMDTPIPTYNMIPPDTVSQVLYDMPQIIVVSTLTLTEQMRITNFLDVCWVVSTPELSTGNSFSWIGGNIIEGSDPLVFTLDGFDGAVTYKISDISGRCVLSGTTVNNDHVPATIEHSEILASGMFILTVTANAETFSQKFIVR